MSQYEARGVQVSGWAIGGLTFAASVLVLIGVFEALEGLAAILNDDFFVKAPHYTYHLDVTAWGWIHLILGILIAFTGFSLFAAKTWAAVTALFLAMLSALANFFFIPYYPWWSLLLIALSIWVIWSLTRPGVVET
jgi:hypothetical protein